jgi:hypothetical protein
MVKLIALVKRKGEQKMHINSPIQTRKYGGKRLALGLVSMFSVAVLGLSGTTFAQEQNGDNPTNGAPTSKDDCKNGGWRDFNFKNQGQCVKWANQHDDNGNGGGNGYGGGNGNNVSTAVNLDISGDNNVVNIIIRYLFG